MQTVGPGRDSSAPNGDVVQAQVDKILASPGFATSGRHSKLLRHLVSMSLVGRGAEIKEYALGVDLFGRGDSFDPQTDAIVRTEVSRLRAKLKVYYSSDGRDDAVIVDLPARSYAPVFRLRESPVEATVETVEPVVADAPPAVAHRWNRLWIVAGLLIAGALISGAPYWLSLASANGGQPVATDEVTSIAVLPFVNSDGDREIEQFTDGLTEEVIETLAEIDGLRVVSRTSAFQFKGKHEDDLRTVARKLNVGAVLEGAVRRSGTHLRITARLVNGAEGYQYYSHVYEHELKNAFTVQREIAAHVANVLQVHERAQEVARFTKSAEAHRRYLQGLYHASRGSESELREAIDSYQRAIASDPNYSPAYTGLSDAYVTLALLNEAEPREAMQRAADAAHMAVKTGDTFAHAHAALGSVLALYNWNWAGAEKEFRKAIKGDPNDSPILQQYAMRYLVPQGNLDSALFELQLAQQVDPFSPLVMLNRGRVYNFKRDPARALKDIHSALGLDPQLEVGPLALAETYLQSATFDEASKTLQESSAPTEDESRLAVLGSVYGLSKKPDRARQILQELGEVDRHRHVSGYYFSQVYLALGETASALDWLERAADEHSPLIVYVKVAPQFDSLREEPRFQAILRRIGLEQ
jgi:TolB-like protein/Tfp pilus assembly protein PilF